jgi:hypothetical protein
MGLFTPSEKKKSDVFSKVKDAGYIGNMDTMSRVNLSLLATMTEMQQAYDAVVAENEQFAAELRRIKEVKKFQ